MKTLVLGGARSGKSRYAQALAASLGCPVTFVATATAADAEMTERIDRHRAGRPADWRVIEEPLHVARILREHGGYGRCVLVDCLTLWLSNLLHGDADSTRECDAFLDALERVEGDVVLVSNEAGLGVVPVGALTRLFVDESGRLHQAVADHCDRVVMTVAGLPLALKGAHT